MATSLGSFAVVSLPPRVTRSLPWEEGGTFHRYWHCSDLEYSFMQPADELVRIVPARPKAAAKVRRFSSQAEVPRLKRSMASDTVVQAAACEALAA
eukprot:4745298-Amphidinium_carterae.1